MRKRIRYAVVGLGNIAQKAVLPAFRGAEKNSEIVALVSSDAGKLKRLGKKYAVANLYLYSQYTECLASGLVDAVYLCTPNTLHHGFAQVAARHGVHVLCEKPMATTDKNCIDMIASAERYGVKLMVAYRLHLEAANLHVANLVKKNKIGAPKIFSSTFTRQVHDKDNIRLRSDLGGGALFDIGIYCINVARKLFMSEPIEVVAFGSRSDDPRFREVDEITSAILRFPGGEQAVFSVSFGAAETAHYDLIGSKGTLHLKNAYEYKKKMKLELVADNKRVELRSFPIRDQFKSELIYFSDCIQKNLEPAPSGWEGLADTRIIQALLRSVKSGAAIRLDPIEKIKHSSELPHEEVHAFGSRRAG